MRERERREANAKHSKEVTDSLWKTSCHSFTAAAPPPWLPAASLLLPILSFLRPAFSSLLLLLTCPAFSQDPLCFFFVFFFYYYYYLFTHPSCLVSSLSSCVSHCRCGHASGEIKHFCVSCGSILVAGLSVFVVDFEVVAVVSESRGAVAVLLSCPVGFLFPFLFMFALEGLGGLRRELLLDCFGGFLR